MPDQVSELFAAPKGELRTVGKVGGHLIYTSSDLKRKYLTAMGKVGKTAPIFKKIIDLTNKGTLTPVYSTYKLLKSLAKRQPLEIRGFAGMVTTDKRIFIFVEAEANLFSFTSNEDLATVTLHELLHFVAGYHPKDFYNIFKQQLEQFYMFYFNRLFSSDPSKIQNNKVKKLVEFIHFQLEPRAFQIPNSILKQYYDMIFDTFLESSTLGEDAFNALVTELIIVIKILQKLAASDSTQYFTRAVMTYKQIITPLYVSYKHIFSVDPLAAKTLCFQELWSTSEVIAIPAMVKTPKPNVYKAINKL